MNNTKPRIRYPRVNKPFIKFFFNEKRVGYSKGDVRAKQTCNDGLLFDSAAAAVTSSDLRLRC